MPKKLLNYINQRYAKGVIIALESNGRTLPLAAKIKIEKLTKRTKGGLINDVEKDF